MSVDPDAEEVCVEGKPGCIDPHLTDAQKASILDDLVGALAEGWWSFDECGTWVQVDGDGNLSSENAARLRAMVKNAQRAVGFG